MGPADKNGEEKNKSNQIRERGSFSVGDGDEENQSPDQWVAFALVVVVNQVN